VIPCSLESTGEGLSNMRKVVWEAVTMYLDREAVESTLRKIAKTAAGTVVAFDYFSAELIESRSLFMRYAGAVVNATGAPSGPNFRAVGTSSRRRNRDSWRRISAPSSVHSVRRITSELTAMTPRLKR
jgi:O-methyltransferase involved in polyketide biosynthesis